eukprot:2954106-Pleurochrysis_carterae.AAC.1
MALGAWWRTPVIAYNSTCYTTCKLTREGDSCPFFPDRIPQTTDWLQLKLGAFHKRLAGSTCKNWHFCASLGLQNRYTTHTKAEHHVFGCPGTTRRGGARPTMIMRLK